MKVTVLTAVYNTQPWLRQCLDSLRRQTLTDAQFICIDDASTDASGQILDEYAAADPRFEVIHLPENRGLAAARNAGLQRAKGEYIATLDSDDWLADDALQQAYETLTRNPQADIALLRLLFVHPDRQTTEFRNPVSATRITGHQAFLLSISRWQIHGLYLIRRSLHQQYPYDDTRPTYSDENTTHLHYLHARQVVFSNGIYYYRQHSESVTRQITLRRFDRLEANLSMKRTLAAEAERGNLPCATTVIRQYEEYRWLNVIDSYWFYYQHRSRFTPEDQEQIAGRFRRILPGIDRALLPLTLKLKFGYIPFSHYTLFRLQENLYCWLKLHIHPTPGA